MKKYIDAEKLIAEIERRLSKYDPDYTNAGSELKELLSFIRSLQQEQAKLPPDLDEAANNYGLNARLGYPRVMDETDKFIYNAFKAGAEWMAGQFQKIDGSLVDWYETNGVEYCHGISTNESFEVPEGFYIRKK